MPNPLLSSLTVPVDVAGTITTVTYDIKDAEARSRIEELGKALYWMGVTTTALTDGATTNPITINGASVTANAGGVAQYNALEYAFDGTAWQLLGEGNLGALAYKNDASASYTPAGSVTVTDGADTTTSVQGITAVGTLPTFTVSGETLTYTAGTLPTADTSKTVVTASGARTASFSGTAATITVS